MIRLRRQAAPIRPLRHPLPIRDARFRPPPFFADVLPAIFATILLFYAPLLRRFFAIMLLPAYLPLPPCCCCAQVQRAA